MYMAGKLSFPGLYENLSTNNTRRLENESPGSICAFFTSRPTCKNTVIVFGVCSTGEGLYDETEDACFGSSNVVSFEGFCGEGSREGSGGTGGGVSSSSMIVDGGLDRCEVLFRSRFDGVTGPSSCSVRTARSPGVNADDAAIDIREPPPPFERIEPPVIFEILYVENRLLARRSSTSWLFRAVNELSIAGV